MGFCVIASLLEVLVGFKHLSQFIKYPGFKVDLFSCWQRKKLPEQYVGAGEQWTMHIEALL